MRVGIIADDLTGAADTGVQFARAGYRTAVAFRGSPIPPAGDLDAAALDTDSRALPSGSAAKRVLEAAGAVRDARIVYKKLDSTLRGPLAAELAAALNATGRDLALVAPAFPATGRTTARGVQLVRGVPVHETEAARDPRTPVVESHLPTLLAAAFPSVVSLGVEDLADGEHVRRVLSNAPCVVADAERDEDLDALARAVPDPRRVLWAGSAGLALALGNLYPGPRAGAAPSRPAPAGTVLVVVGSLSGVAREQLRSLEEHGCTTVPVATGGRSVSDGVGVARAALAEGSSCAALHSAEERRSSDAGAVVAALAEVAAGLAGDGSFDALVLTGGETAVSVARRLGAWGILLEGEVETGMPVGTLIGPSPYRVVTKAGAFGEPDTLRRVVEKLLENGEVC
ncbi:MAG TPA: four-carbon acid sugar kinase family protein [Rubrobacteraceae bacterium]|nr:four-carbon acid sugar kinase family protein [Rubrobacteraceae bacterium]